MLQRWHNSSLLLYYLMFWFEEMQIKHRGEKQIDPFQLKVHSTSNQILLHLILKNISPQIEFWFTLSKKCFTSAKSYFTLTKHFDWGEAFLGSRWNTFWLRWSVVSCPRGIFLFCCFTSDWTQNQHWGETFWLRCKCEIFCWFTSNCMWLRWKKNIFILIGTQWGSLAWVDPDRRRRCGVDPTTAQGLGPHKPRSPTVFLNQTNSFQVQVI